LRESLTCTIEAETRKISPAKSSHNGSAIGNEKNDMEFKNLNNFDVLICHNFLLWEFRKNLSAQELCQQKYVQ
jgi:hypothetical protein